MSCPCVPLQCCGPLRTGALAILRHPPPPPPPPGLSRRLCCHAASVSLTSDTLLRLLCQLCLVSVPAGRPPSEYHLMLLLPPPPNCQGAITSSQRRLLHCLLISTPTRISDRTQLKSEAKVFLFYFSALVYKVSLPVCTCQCLCVSSDARGCCCWDFAAQHAAYHHLQFK